MRVEDDLTSHDHHFGDAEMERAAMATVLNHYLKVQSTIDHIETETERLCELLDQHGLSADRVRLRSMETIAALQDYARGAGSIFTT